MVTIDRERCTGCATCVVDCVKENIVIEEGAARILDDCFNCGHCVAICPAGYVPSMNIPLSAWNTILRVFPWRRRTCSTR